MFGKKREKTKEDKKLLEELNKKYQKVNATNETTLIDVDALKKENENTLIYKKFSKLENNELLYKLKNEKLDQNEKEVITTILDERKNQK